ncbi:MAG TPA: DNA repair protein RadA [Dehalococcoidia bacterium]|nr:DNA repair protein RadA [Dehalococcoidia bacterium]|tara:strand:- start:639 stop:2027 length:1389 start_codon:yes stop_codon:yes gene_type:complete
MAALRDTVWVCNECGSEFKTYSGFCPSPVCESRNPLREFHPETISTAKSWLPKSFTAPVNLSDVSILDEDRWELNNQELNRVLGGGIVSDSVVLLTGEPGIGKSTLLLQIADNYSEKPNPVIYLSGEESSKQLKSRSERLGIAGTNIVLFNNTNLETFFSQIQDYNPSLIIVDSIQTLEIESSSGTAGSVSQIRDCGLMLMQWAKSCNVPIIISGHVTKDGTVAGPRALEHIVDVVLYLEGENLNNYRLLRSTKNRFGSSSEVGVLQMTNQGLVAVLDPSKNLISSRVDNAPGSCLIPVMEGNRSLMMEVQGLTSLSFDSRPRRVVNGIEFNRLLMLTAVLGKRSKISFTNQDVIMNVVGGFKINEPAADCAIICSLVSSFKDTPVDENLVAFGEIGLTGELRQVSNVTKRLEEAHRLGFKKCVIPKSDDPKLAGFGSMEIIEAVNINEVISNVFSESREFN